MGTPENRATLANSILALYQQFGLDGVDLDWEYPGQNGNSGNGVSPDDSANFLEFLYALRSALPPGAKITAATQTVPFAGPDGSPRRDVSDFASVLDWVLIMNYDTWGCEWPPILIASSSPSFLPSHSASRMFTPVLSLPRLR